MYFAIGQKTRRQSWQAYLRMPNGKDVAKLQLVFKLPSYPGCWN